MSTIDETVSFSLEINVQEAYTNARQLQTILSRTAGLMRRMGLPENVDAAMMKLQRITATANAARLAMIAFTTATGPLGWGMAAVAIGAVAFSVADLAMELE